MTHTEYNQPQRSGREAQCFKHISRQITENSPLSGQNQDINCQLSSGLIQRLWTLQIQPKAMVLVMGLGREPRGMLLVVPVFNLRDMHGWYRTSQDRHAVRKDLWLIQHGILVHKYEFNCFNQEFCVPRVLWIIASTWVRWQEGNCNFTPILTA